MTSKKNILFLSSWYPNHLTPQAGNFVQNHALAVSELHQVYVLHAIAKDQEEDFTFEDRYTGSVREVIVYYKKIRQKIPLISALKKYNAMMAAYYKGFELLMNDIGTIDLIHLNVTFPAGLFALDLKKKLNIPYILTEHWTAFLPDDPHSFSALEKKYILKIAEEASVICPVSENLAQAMKAFGIRNEYRVIPNVVDTEIFKPAAVARTERKNLLHISNLRDEHKNISGILNVVKKLSETRDDFSLTIAGNGDIDFFSNQARQLGIPETCIRFEGEKSPQEVAKLMQRSDVFILFSHYENLPCVISESLVCGKPVVASDVGGISEMLNDSNGLLIGAGNETACFEALNNMLDHMNDYDNTRIAGEAAKIYGHHEVARQFSDVYLKTLAAWS